MYTNDKIYTTERMTGGIKRFKMLYDGLIKKGYDVTLFCGETKEELDKYNKQAFSINRDIKKKRFFNGINIYFNNRKIIKELKKDKYDEVIVFDVPTAIGLCLKKMKNVNLFLRQDLIEYRKILLKENNKGKLYSKIYLNFMNLCEYLCCKRSKKIIVQCNYDLNNLLNRHKTIKKSIKEKSYVQINNVNAPWIVDKSKKEIEYKMEDNKSFKICFIGDFSNTRKGHDIFLNAIKRLLDEKENIKAYVIGDGKLLENEKDIYSDYKNIIFMGRLNNPIDVIKQVDLVVVPSRADSCPNTVLESLYNNILVIGANAGGIPEILNNNDMLFEPESKSLYEKIREVYSDNYINKKILTLQKQRNKELSFDWVNKISKILDGGNNENKKK
jgi:glycosyltransferase involved in cell wall biosynthesis